jgi:hypothetical protein
LYSRAKFVLTHRWAKNALHYVEVKIMFFKSAEELRRLTSMMTNTT